MLVSDNIFPSVLFNGAAGIPANPAADQFRSFFKTDGLMYAIGSSGDEYAIAGWVIEQKHVSPVGTNITTGTAKLTWRMPFKFTLLNVRASVAVAPTGANLVIDLNKNGTTVLSTKLSIDAGEKTSTTASSSVVVSVPDFDDDDEVTVDFDQVGSTIAGQQVIVTLYGRRAV